MREKSENWGVCNPVPVGRVSEPDATSGPPCAYPRLEDGREKGSFSPEAVSKASVAGQQASRTRFCPHCFFIPSSHPSARAKTRGT